MGCWYHASWPHLRKLFPFAALGILIAIWVGEVVNDGTFKVIMAVLILIGIPVMIIMTSLASIRLFF